MKRFAIVLTVLASLVVSQQKADAAFLPSFTGNSWYADLGGNGGWVSYAVYRNTGPTGNWMVDLGLPMIPPLPQAPFGPAPNGGENMVFFFQVVADAGAATTFTLDPGTPLNIASAFADTGGPTKPWSAIAHYDGIVFDDGAPVGTIGNEGVGVEAAKVAPAPTGTVGTPAGRFTTLSSGGGAPGVPTVGGLVPPYGGPPLSFAPDLLPGGPGFGIISSAATGGITWVPPSTPGISTSPLIVLTSSNLHVFYGVGNISGPGGADVLLPMSNPEPGSLALLAFGLAGGVVLRHRKKKSALTKASP